MVTTNKISIEYTQNEMKRDSKCHLKKNQLKEGTQDPNLCYLLKIHFSSMDTYLKVKGEKETVHTNSKRKQGWLAGYTIIRKNRLTQ